MNKTDSPLVYSCAFGDYFTVSGILSEITVILFIKHIRRLMKRRLIILFITRLKKKEFVRYQMIN